MATHRLAGVLLVSGSLIFVLGAAVGVPAVFTERNPEARLRLLEAGLVRWQVAQPLYGLGPLIVAAGVGVLAMGAPTLPAQTGFAIAFLALSFGALAWAWSLYLRGTRFREFAFGTLPAWPFTTYILLTIGGLALLALGLLTGGFPGWLGWLTVAADVGFLAGYLWFKDIPPFVFYLLLLLAGAVIL